MSAVRFSLMALVLVAACDGNPFVAAPAAPTDPTTPDGGGIHGVELPPGTTDPTASSDITRQEAQDTDRTSPTYGNGYVSSYSYNAANDTFNVDGLAFDGGNVYQRGTAVGSINGYAVYQADDIYNDDVTGYPINQFSHRAIYGVSTTGKTAFAIVRTGAYVPYGFGGFIYQRNGKVTLPTSGQAHFAGDYAGLRDFSGKGGMEYTDGKMTVDIDFNDFDTGSGVKGYVTGRHIYDMNGADITMDYLAAMNLNLNPDSPLTALPTLVFAVGPGAIDANGEISGQVGSNYASGGALATLESGVYYAVIAGDATTANSEIAGIIVVTSAVPGATTVTVRETGGFILYR